VEEAQGDATAPRDGEQRHLHLVQRPARGQVPAVLVAVRVPEHHLLRAAARGEVARVCRVCEQRVEHRRRRFEITDRLEERYDVQVERGLGAHAQEPRLLEQQQRLEHVARRARLRDDVVRDRARAEPRPDVARGVQHRELAPRDLAVARLRHREPPRPGQLARQERDARGLVQPLVVRRDLRRREQLGDDRLLDRGALAQV
jgi:hypothetical protein